MMKFLIVALLCSVVSGFTFVHKKSPIPASARHHAFHASSLSRKSKSELKMLEGSIFVSLDNVVEGAAVALAGVSAGIALAVFTEGRGDRARTRGGSRWEYAEAALIEGVAADPQKALEEKKISAQVAAALAARGAAAREKTEEEEEKTEEGAPAASEAQSDDGW